MRDLTSPLALPGPIQLKWEGTTPVITPDVEKRIAQQSGWPGMPFPVDLAAERFWRQFRDEFLTAVHTWCVRHADRVVACYVPFSRDHLRVFVVSRSPTFDFSLSDDLTDLEMDLFDKQWPADINQIPSGPSVLEAFFKPAESIQVYGNAG
jgi:hypothetical protein